MNSDSPDRYVYYVWTIRLHVKKQKLADQVIVGASVMLLLSYLIELIA